MEVTVTDGRVTTIVLDDNNLNGPIPPEIGNLTNLEFIYLQRNDLSGNIPKEIGNLTNLYVLYLFNNNLTGEIPPEMGNMENLSLLWLGENDLTGEIPKEFENLSNLQTLDLGDNDLTGSIPSYLGTFPRLSNLSLFDNGFTGEIPSELGNLRFLSTISLENNNLSGSINAIKNLKNLNHLRLTNNNFSGSVPTELWNNTNLLFAWLGDNQLDFIEPINSLPANAKVKLNNNKIGFSSIILYTDDLQSYNNQIIDGRDTLIGTETRDIALTISDNHPDNSYQWYKDGNTIAGATDRRYVINNLSFADAGKYYASITNSNFDPAKYTFWRDTIYVTIITLREADSLALVDLYNSTNGPEWENEG